MEVNSRNTPDTVNDHRRRARIYLLFSMLIIFSFLQSGARARRYRDTSNLKLEFHIQEEIDLGRKGLRRAAQHLESGDSSGCVKEVLNYFISRKTPCRLDIFGNCPGAVERAGSILENRYPFWIYDSYELPLDLGWNENPANSRNWVYFLQSFEFLWILNAAYETSGDGRYLRRGMELVADFVKDNYDPWKLPSPDLSWYDHTVANRAIFLVDFWRLLEKSGDMDLEFVRIFLDLIWRHAKFIVQENNYSKDNNHGMFCSAALLRISLAFPEFREAGLWRELAVSRMEAQVLDNFTASGLHKEYSPWYHIWVAGLLKQFCDDCRDNGVRLSEEVIDRANKINDGIMHFIFPDGTISLLGDSDAEPTEKLMDTALSSTAFSRYVRSKGGRGRRPRIKSKSFPDAKIFVMRSGWGKVRSFGEESCLIANFSGTAKNHDQLDFMTFELYSRGQKWITDLGRFGYNYNDPRRQFLTSPRAHNIIVPYSRIYKASRGEKAPASARRGTKTRVTQNVKRNVFHVMRLIDEVPLSSEKELRDIIYKIGKFRDADDRIVAYEHLLEREPPGFEEKIQLLLAFCYGEIKGDTLTAASYLNEIIEKGPDNPYYDTAIAFFTKPDYKFWKPDSAGRRTEGRSETGRLPESTAKDGEGDLTSIEKEGAASGRDTSLEGEAAESFHELFSEIKPDRKEKPEVEYWISNNKFDYLEGSFKYSRDITHSRAILFIKPYFFLITDKIESKRDIKAKQFFHLPPAVDVAGCKDGFRLFTGDSRQCLLLPLFHSVPFTTRIVKGETAPEYQGWYSDKFWRIVEAPVIEHSMDIQAGSCCLVHLIVPTGRDDPGEYEIKLSSGINWDSENAEPLRMEIEEPGFRTKLTYKPSSSFIPFPAGCPDAPVVRVTRRRR